MGYTVEFVSGYKSLKYFINFMVSMGI